MRLWNVCLVIFALGLLEAPRAPCDPILIRISTQTPLASPSNLTFIHFKERVEKESQGEIRVEIYDSARLFDDSQIAGAVADGKVEIGFVVLSRYAAKIPATDIFQLPFLFNEDVIASEARKPDSEIRLMIDQAILEQGRARVLWWIPLGQNVLLSSSSLADPASLAGKTVRTYGPMMEAFVDHCGGQHKDIGGPAQAKAYETHAVEVGMAGVGIMMARKLFQFMPTVTRTNHATVEDVAVINEAFWQKLSEKHKAILLAAAKEADAEAARLIAEIEATAYRTLTENKLADVVKLTPDQVLLWRICSSDVLADFMDRSGVLGRQLIIAYGRLRQKPCCNKVFN
jgi:C4-dicarboxylate-binding protein DctP